MSIPKLVRSQNNHIINNKNIKTIGLLYIHVHLSMGIEGRRRRKTIGCVCCIMDVQSGLI